MRLEQGDFSAAKLRPILDVVVHEKRVVKQLERRRGYERLLRAAARRPARGEADRWTKSLALAKRIVGEHIVERAVSGATTFGKKCLELATHGLSRIREDAVHKRFVMHVRF